MSSVSFASDLVCKTRRKSVEITGPQAATLAPNGCGTETCMRDAGGPLNVENRHSPTPRFKIFSVSDFPEFAALSPSLSPRPLCGLFRPTILHFS